MTIQQLQQNLNFIKKTIGFENFPDNSWQEVAFEGLSTGYYLIVITGDVPASDYGVAVWKSTKVSSSITFIDGKRAEVGLYGALLTE